MSDQDVEDTDASELDLEHEEPVDEAPQPLSDEAMLAVDDGSDGEG